MSIRDYLAIYAISYSVIFIFAIAMEFSGIKKQKRKQLNKCDLLSCRKRMTK